MNFTVEIPCLSAALFHYVTGKVCRYLLLLVIVGKLDTKGIFQGRNHGAYTLIREILAVGNHIENVCLHLVFLDIRVDSDTCYLHTFFRRKSNHLANLNMAGCSHTVFGQRKVELLHVLVFCLYNFYLTAASTAIQPGIDMILILEISCLDFAHRFSGYDFHLRI